MKNIRFFFNLKIFIFLGVGGGGGKVKFSMYLNRRVFVMVLFQGRLSPLNG